MKLHHAIPVLVLIIFIYACHQDKHHHKNHKQKSLSNDTLFVTKRSAISIWLDTATLEKRRKQYGDEAFEIGSDDNVYYSSIADSVLKSHQLSIVDVKGYRYVKFVQNNKASKTIKIDTLPQVYTLYFFDPSKTSQNVDVTDIDNEYKNFYH
jgi:hypothetical protein